MKRDPEKTSLGGRGVGKTPTDGTYSSSSRVEVVPSSKVPESQGEIEGGGFTALFWPGAVAGQPTRPELLGDQAPGRGEFLDS